MCIDTDIIKMKFSKEHCRFALSLSGAGTGRAEGGAQEAEGNHGETQDPHPPGPGELWLVESRSRDHSAHL